jgi:diketogulonate reductase-like aldo/keto reductase
VLCKRSDIISFCHERKIVLLAYGFFGSRESTLLDKEEVKLIADDLKISCGNVLLAWARAKGLVVVFGSSSKEHIQENYAFFDSHISLTVAQMSLLDSLEEKYGTLVMGWKGVVDLDSVE